LGTKTTVGFVHEQTTQKLNIPKIQAIFAWIFSRIENALIFACSPYQQKEGAPKRTPPEARPSA
jgi:hypothetical protein